MFTWAVAVFWASVCFGTAQPDASFVSAAGSNAAINSWHLHSSEGVSTNMSVLSSPNVDVSSWYRVSSRGTLMAGLLENDVYDDYSLFFSNNLATMVNHTQFTVPWLYRTELNLQWRQENHYFLQTNGISSKADVYVNGKQVASKDMLNGAYGGQKLDITSHVNSGKNALLIRVYPTSYQQDFALGFVDWNPYPPDNGTGIWREVSVSETGPVSLSIPRIVTNYNGNDARPVIVTVKAIVQNHGTTAVNGKVTGILEDEKGTFWKSMSTFYSLKTGESKTISMHTEISNPKLWWPKKWGDQNLYTVELSALIGTNTLADKSAPRTFGIRHVVSQLNQYNDTTFKINGYPFQVLGAGYSPDIFLRFDEEKLASQFSYMLDMGLNTVRLEGKQEHPALYDLASRMGLMVLAGWECCDKWEGWEYNEDVVGVPLWSDVDYDTAEVQMRHEAAMMQAQPCMLGFLVGSDYWPDDRAAGNYMRILKEMDWDVPVIASAAQRGYPEILGPSGMKMDGPYDWVSPSYWYGDKLGAAFGFGSELGSGVGTPELLSLQTFLSTIDQDALWSSPNSTQYHLSVPPSPFSTRSIYNNALSARYGPFKSLADYLLKAQATDYEAVRAQYEAYSVRKTASRPATGMIYWMLNSAWPSLHWGLFDYYLNPAGSYFGAKVGARQEHVVLDAGNNRDIWVVNHGLYGEGERVVDIDVISSSGTHVLSKSVTLDAKPNQSQLVSSLRDNSGNEIPGPTKGEVQFVRLVLRLGNSGFRKVLSRNVYWLSSAADINDWRASSWYSTPLSQHADFTPLTRLEKTSLNIEVVCPDTPTVQPDGEKTLRIWNDGKSVAWFVRMSLRESGQEGEGERVNSNGNGTTNADQGLLVAPVWWEDNYITLWPGEALDISVRWDAEGNTYGDADGNRDGDVDAKEKYIWIEAGNVDGFVLRI